MKPKSRLVFGPIFCAALAASGYSAEISGSLSILGCPADLPQIEVKARPMTGPAAGSEETIVAKLAPIQGGEFSFLFSGAREGQIYQLSAKLNTPKCGKMFWRAPRMGLVHSGQTNATILGTAIRNQIEIWGTKKTGRGAEGWLGIDTVDLTSESDYLRNIRIRTDLANVTAFQIQVSRTPFNTDTTPAFMDTGEPGIPAETACLSDSGSNLLRSQRLSVSGKAAANGWFEFSNYNLLSLVTPPVQRVSSGSDGLPVEYKQPLFIRAIPITLTSTGTEQRRCSVSQDGFPGWIILQATSGLAVSNPLANPSAKVYSAVYQGPRILPYPWNDRTTCYRTTQPHTLDTDYMNVSKNDFHGFFYMLNGGRQYGEGSITYYQLGQTIPKNSVMCMTSNPDNQSWAEELTGLVTGFVDSLGMLVSQTALGYELIKQTVAKVIVAVASTVTDCGEACKGYIEQGLNLGLIALGMPPSLPNWDELKQEGLAYLAAEIAEQAGVDASIAEKVAPKAIDLAQTALDKMTEQRGGSGGLPGWLTYDIGFYPAVLRVTLKETDAVRPSAWKMYLGDGDYFLGAAVDIPKTFRPSWSAIYDQKMTFPIVLQPRWTGSMPCGGISQGCTDYKAAVYRKDSWVKHLNEHVYNQKPVCTMFPLQVVEPMGALVANLHDRRKLSAFVLSTTYFGAPLPEGEAISACQ